jgi:hypothetical protein
MPKLTGGTLLPSGSACCYMTIFSISEMQYYADFSRGYDCFENQSRQAHNKKEPENRVGRPWNVLRNP